MTNQDAEVFLIALRPSRHQLIHGGFGPDFQGSLPTKELLMKLLSNMAERRICPQVDNLVRILRKIEELWPKFLMQHVFPGGGSDDPCTTVIGVHLKALTGSTTAKINFTDRNSSILRRILTRLSTWGQILRSAIFESNFMSSSLVGSEP